MTVLLVTGTSTGVGKTVVTAALAAIARAQGSSVAVCKPAQTGVDDGEPGDLADVSRLAGEVDTSELARYPEPLAPLTAARRSGRPLLTLNQVTAEIERLRTGHDVVIVEGAGGVLVELGEGGFTLRDVAQETGGDVLVVASPALGTLNHTALTVEALKRSDVRCIGIVVGAMPDEPDLAMRCNLDDLPRVTGLPLAGVLPEGCGQWPNAAFSANAASWFTAELAATLRVSSPLEEASDSL